jgi:hypothetical protein
VLIKRSCDNIYDSIASQLGFCQWEWKVKAQEQWLTVPRALKVAGINWKNVLFQIKLSLEVKFYV